MAEQTPAIDFENLPAPSEGFLVTLFITVRSVARSRAFYSEVLGGKVVLEENPCMVKLADSWLIMNPGGGRKGGRVRDAADRSRCRDPVLYARPRRLHDRSRPVHRTARRQTRQEAPRRSARLRR